VEVVILLKFFNDKQIIMKQTQENKSRMYRAVDNNLTANETTWKPNKGFSGIVDDFRKEKADFDVAAQKQAKETKGITDNKNATKMAVIKEAVLMTGNVRAYAKKNGHIDLFDQMNFSQTTFIRFTEVNLKVVLGNIYDAVKGITDGGDFGVNTASVNKLKALIDAFVKTLGDPRTARDARKTATADIEEHIARVDEELDLIDGMIGNFEDANHEFVSNHYNARGIDDYGHGGKKKGEEGK
jgi:hypothetical protein